MGELPFVEMGELPFAVMGEFPFAQIPNHDTENNQNHLYYIYLL